jgi:hypothetical protein
MCIPDGEKFKPRINKKGEGVGYKLFQEQGDGELYSLLYFMEFKRGLWIKSKSGPGFFIFALKKEAMNDGWSYDKLLRVRFRGVKHAAKWPREPKSKIIVAKEIFIPKEA